MIEASLRLARDAGAVWPRGSPQRLRSALLQAGLAWLWREATSERSAFDESLGTVADELQGAGRRLPEFPCWASAHAALLWKRWTDTGDHGDAVAAIEAWRCAVVG